MLNGNISQKHFDHLRYEETKLFKRAIDLNNGRVAILGILGDMEKWVECVAVGAR